MEGGPKKGWGLIGGPPKKKVGKKFRRPIRKALFLAKWVGRMVGTLLGNSEGKNPLLKKGRSRVIGGKNLPKREAPFRGTPNLSPEEITP